MTYPYTDGETGHIAVHNALEVTLGGKADKLVAQAGETGVTNTAHPRGDVRRYGAIGDGTTDDTAALTNAISSALSGGTVVIPADFNCRITSTITIAKTITFGGEGKGRSSNDNSDPAGVGARITYDATAGDALLVQVPNTANYRIYPRLRHLQVLGNKNKAGATGGGGITISGRGMGGTAVNNFIVEDVHVSEAKGDGLTVADNVYEGLIRSVYVTDCGGKGIASNATGGGLPGEILLLDVHTHDNAGDGIELRGGGSWTLVRVSSSRNAGCALDASGVQLNATDLQFESNTGAVTVILDAVVRCVIQGLNVAYPASYTGVGVDITNAATKHVTLLSSFFTGACTYDLRNAAGQEGVVIIGYHASAAARTSLVNGTHLLLGAANNEISGTVSFLSTINTNDIILAAGAAMVLTGKFQFGSDGRPKWIDSGNTQTTVGAAGGASALPATPKRYMHIRDSDGTILVIPAYNQA